MTWFDNGFNDASDGLHCVRPTIAEYVQGYEYYHELRKREGKVLGYKRDMQYKMQFEEEQKQQSALDTQVGGDHYKQLKIEPTVYCQTNGFRHGESSAIKYISRYHVKRNPIDLDKAIHFFQIVKEIDNVREG